MEDEALIKHLRNGGAELAIGEDGFSWQKKKDSNSQGRPLDRFDWVAFFSCGLDAGLDWDGGDQVLAVGMRVNAEAACGRNEKGVAPRGGPGFPIGVEIGAALDEGDGRE